MSVPDQDPLTDTEKYQILGPIGRGGMGEVYLALDRRLQRKVAIKHLRQDFVNTDWRGDLSREAQLLAQLNHPNIVQVYDIIQHRGSPALVMEYVEGRNLHIQLRERQSDLSELLRWLAEIAAGIAAAHDAGIAHNDLKAENVLIGSDNIAKVTDFGIAGDAADTRDDILALGRLATHMVGGKPDLSPALRQLLQQLTHRNPSRRPPALAAAEALRVAWLESTQLETAIPTAAAGAKRGRIHWWLLSGMVLVLAAAASVYRLMPEQPPSISYVAVLPTALNSRQQGETPAQDLLRAAVHQALRQNVIDTPELSLVSIQDTAREKGELTEIAAALGADELIVSMLDCRSARSCELAVERLNGRDLSVIKQSTTSIIVDLLLESVSIVQRQWQHLYPGEFHMVDASDLISEDTYRQFLALYEASHIGGSRQIDTLAGLEALLGNANRFLPIYLLYAHSALEVYDETGDPRYLEKLRAVLNYVETWAGGSLPLSQAWVLLALETREFDLADEEIAEMESLGADAALINSLKGELNRYLAEHALAQKYYEAAITLQPSRKLYNKLADNYRLWGKYDLAIETYRKSLALFPGDLQDETLLGLILLEQGNVDEAIDVLTSVRTSEPKSLYLNDLGLAYMIKGDMEESRRVFLEAYDLGVRDPILRLNLADAEALTGHVESAEKLYRELIAQSIEQPNSVKLWIVAQAYAQLGEFEAAIHTLHQITEIDGESPFNAALVFTLANQKIAAIVQVDKAIKADFGAVWFRLPWFDVLCSESRFADLIAQAGIPDRCEI